MMRRWRWPWEPARPEPVLPPKVGGTRAPDQVIRIDFGRPHDFHFRFDGGSATFLGCILVGFTTPTDADGNPLGGAREWDHDRWLVLRRPDGRLLYAPRQNLQYIEESSAVAASDDRESR